MRYAQSPTDSIIFLDPYKLKHGRKFGLEM